jgi:predicted secreted Zn-dependent protease
MKKELIKRNQKKQNNKKVTGNSQRQIVNRQFETSENITNLVPLIGNAEVQRVISRQKKADSHTAGSGAAGMQHLLGSGNLFQVVAGTAPQIFREEGDESAEELSGGNAGGNGTVTINAPAYDYYDVSGTTLAEVGDLLDPTEWGRCNVRYTYSYSATNGRVTSVTLTVNITIRMPRWSGQGYQNASPAARAEWNRMVAALGAHENQHAGIGRTWAPTIRSRLLSAAEADLNSTLTQGISDAQVDQDQFDSDTDHGQTQGVSLDTSIT